jgi:hypothetical protein
MCGALILPALTADTGVRWSIAGGAGVAVAALAALWGHVYAVGPRPGAGHDKPAAPAASAREHQEVRNTIGGDVSGTVFQGRDFHGPISLGTAEPADFMDGREPDVSS